MQRKVLLLVVVLLIGNHSFSQEENLNVLEGWKNHDIRWITQTQARYSPLNRLNAKAHRLLDQRDALTSELRTADDWKRRQRDVRDTLNTILGPWPQKNPLNAQRVRVLKKDGFRIELLTFESLPGFYVTAALYVPSGLEGKAPGIVYIPGHANNGFRASHYQKFCLNLVHKGFVVLTYDPIGQGERRQNVDPGTGETFIDSSQFKAYKMHSYPGNQCYLSGVSIARYFVWDAIRALDYLETRPEVDKFRLGVTGNSGGGNITAFVSAVDDRVAVSVPSCWITSYRRMLEINGLQDAEQNVLNGLTHGIEHIDWLLARAPKPTLLMTTTRDFFPIQGARETDLEAQRIWTALGAPGNFARTEDDHGHGYTRKNSEAAYDFFMSHLNQKGSSEENDYALFTDEELRITETGQVVTALQSDTIQSINYQYTKTLLGNLKQSRLGSDHLKAVERSARLLSGFESVEDIPRSVYRGGYQRDGYRVDRYGLISSDESVVPVLLFQPDSPGPHSAIILAHPEGKSFEAEKGGFIESLVLKGRIVAAVDIANTGETELPIGRQNDRNILFYTGAMTGNSVVALQAADLIRTLAGLRSMDRVQVESIGLLTYDQIGPTALHAAVFDSGFEWLALIDAPLDYASMVANRRYLFESDCMVAGALTAYDLPDLLARFAPKKTILFRSVDENKQSLKIAAIEDTLEYPIRYYGSQNASSNLRIEQGDETALLDLIEWCEK